MTKRKTTEQFIAEARTIHGDKYDYSKTRYVNAKTKVCIICPEHGEFWQNPNKHIKDSNGCPKCMKKKFSKLYLKTTEQFIEEARQVHGDKYDYSKVEYKGNKTKVCIICPEHGEFWQQPVKHVNEGNGCPKCGRKKSENSHRKTMEKFVKEACAAHGNKYDYSKVEYKGREVKVCIICSKHGEFWQRPDYHLNGGGCPKCARKTRKKTTEQFIQEARQIHGNKYDYSKTRYKGAFEKVCIICPEHGEFWQIPYSHIKSCGCPECSNRTKITTKKFIARAKKVHGNKYDYSESNHEKTAVPIKIICQKHGPFWQISNNHLKGHGCPRCATRISKPEQEIVDWIRSLGFDIIQSHRGWCKERPGLEIDIFVPTLNLGIEYNGNRWHSSQFHPDPKWHQQQKMLAAAEAGIHLITIPEWMWHQKQPIIKRILADKLGVNNDKVYARKCQLVEIEPSVANRFHTANHIHGFVGAHHHFALKDQSGKIAAVLSVSDREKWWEITRYSTSKKVVGGFSKMFKHFVNQHHPETVISYADARFWSGCSYRSAGFVLDGLTNPGYGYIRDETDFYSRQRFQKHKLAKLFGENFDPALTEEENCANNGWYRLYDCGHWKWMWQPKN